MSEQNNNQDDIRKIIAKNVFNKLGRPNTYLKYNLNNIYRNKYRINIFLQDGKISDSFFLHISQKGEIEYANPEIVRRYE